MEGIIASPRLAEEYLPNEMWDMVFGYLDKEEDVLRCYNTCTNFRDILKPRVFAQALAVVQRQLSKTSSTLEAKDVLSCRPVSGDSLMMTDNFLQSRASRLDLSCYQPVTLGYRHSFISQLPDTPNGFGAICLQMSKLEEAHVLVEKIISNTRVRRGANVLIGRHLIIVGCRDSFLDGEDSRNPDKQRFYDIVSRLLTACGKHIWYLSVSDAISFGLPELFFDTYWKWLQLVPHLKMLTCEISARAVDPSVRLEVQQKLRDRIGQHPFPRLPQLVTLQLNGIPDIVVKSVLNVNPHIRKVEVSPFRYEDGLGMDFSEWWNAPLTEFCFVNCNATDLFQITEMGWPLEKLTIRFDLDMGPLHWYTEYYLHQLSHFSETLKYLRLEIPNRFADLEEPDWELRLPNLEELHLDSLHHTRLDLLLPCQSLKKLKLSVLYNQIQTEPLLILRDTAVPMTCLYQSIIWEEFPSLKVVHLQMLKPETQTIEDLFYYRSEMMEIE